MIGLDQQIACVELTMLIAGTAIKLPRRKWMFR